MKISLILIVKFGSLVRSGELKIRLFLVLLMPILKIWTISSYTIQLTGTTIKCLGRVYKIEIANIVILDYKIDF